MTNSEKKDSNESATNVDIAPHAEPAVSKDGSAQRSGFVALVGPANAGKSTLLNAILQQKVSIVSAKPHTTRDRILGIKHFENAECIFVDSPGFCAENYNGALSRYLRKSLRQASTDVDLCALVLDTAVFVKSSEYFEEAVKLLKRDAGTIQT